MRWRPATTIVIDIAPSQVTFTDTDDVPGVVTPVVYIALEARRARVVAVGAPPPAGTPALRVDVFSQEPPPSGISKLDCLAALFTHGLKAIVERSLFRVRPEVQVRGAESVSRSFGGYERDLFALALERAGAKRVHWSHGPQAQ